MSTIENVSKFFYHGCDSHENFLNSHDSVVTAMKSQNAFVSLDVSGGSTGVDVTLVSTPLYKEKMKRCRTDCKTLGKTPLRRKYPSEEITHRNMLARSNPHVSARFRKFADFLFEVGPKPFPKATLDRIDNSDPVYAPGKVRWADAHTQSNNRSISRLFDDPDGNQYTVAQLAKRQNVSPNAIHQRLRRGWSYPQIVAGDRSSPGPNSPTNPKPNVVEENKAPTIFLAVPDLKPVWLEEMDAAHDGEWHHLSSREKKGLRNIAERCSGTGLRYYEEGVVRCALKNWARFIARAKSEEGAYGLPSNPTVDFLEKYSRVAVNLFLEENDLEFKNSTVRPREKSCAPPKAVAAHARLTSAPVPHQALRDVPYEPPALPLNPKEWQALSAEQKEGATRRAEKNLVPYNARYTADTGRLPPEECRCPLNIDAFLSYLYPPGRENEW